MNLVRIVVHFEFADRIESILDEFGIEQYVRISGVESKDADGKHFGTKVYPGMAILMEALVEDSGLPDLLHALKEFKEERPVHRHIQIQVLRIEQVVK
ncbi:MAG: PG0541 family transporter-associated protein [Desulfovibrionales bacterium]